MKIVVFLQNAWSPLYAGRRWRREAWLRALNSSRSGQRLRILANACDDGTRWWYDNTTPICGGEPSSVVSADLFHMQLVVEGQNPDKVICMGQQAKLSWRDLKVRHPNNFPTLFMPHPAYRVLTNQLLYEAAELLAAKWEGTKELKQLRGEVCCVP